MKNLFFLYMKNEVYVFVGIGFKKENTPILRVIYFKKYFL